MVRLSGRRKVEGSGLVDIGAIADVLGDIDEDLTYCLLNNRAPSAKLVLEVQDLRSDVLRMLKELKK